MRVLSFITEPPVVRKILEHLQRTRSGPTRSPPGLDPVSLARTHESKLERETRTPKTVIAAAHSATIMAESSRFCSDSVLPSEPQKKGAEAAR